MLLELQYFDAVQMCIIDPMHNLLLGPAKHMIAVWKSCNLLSDSYLPLFRIELIHLFCHMMLAVFHIKLHQVLQVSQEELDFIVLTTCFKRNSVIQSLQLLVIICCHSLTLQQLNEADDFCSLSVKNLLNFMALIIVQ